MKKLSFYLLPIFLVGFVACHQGASDSSAPASPYNAGDYEEKQQSPGEPPPPGNQGITIERKLIKEGSLEYKVDNLVQSRASLLRAVERWKGYVGNESEAHSSDRNSTTIVIRVPAANFDSLLTAATLGVAGFDVKDILVRDVTAEYVDVEARLKAKKEIEKRYLELLGKANTVTEVLEVEKELGILRADIESIEGRLNVLKSEVAFSTLTITMYQTVSAPTYFWDKIASGFVNGWQALLSFIVGLVNLWPFLILGIGAYLGIRRWRMGRRVQRMNA